MLICFIHIIWPQHLRVGAMGKQGGMFLGWLQADNSPQLPKSCCNINDETEPVSTNICCGKGKN